jgi:ribosomal-protein-alanine N-acetyltransferase
MARALTPATAADLDAIMRIEEGCFDARIREARESFADRLETFPAGFLLLRDAAEATPVGYLCSEIWEAVPSAEPANFRLGHSARERHSPNGTVLYVSSFAVLPSARGGAGRYLFREGLSSIAATCPRLRRVAFVVCDSWLAARHIYETEGFAYTGRIGGFFPPTSDALVMEREL